MNATVLAYKKLLDDVRSSLPINKASTYRGLSSTFGRTPGAYERRMQNISAILAELEIDWLPGLLPMRNIGTHVRPRLVKWVRNAFAQETLSTPAFEPEVANLIRGPSLPVPVGQRSPASVVKTITDRVRDVRVKAWVLRHANGTCECCRQPAPFQTLEGLPYLEVHHIKTLASGGPDTIDNAVALCPNCHRRLHYSDDASEVRKRMISEIARLQPAR